MGGIDVFFMQSRLPVHELVSWVDKKVEGGVMMS